MSIDKDLNDKLLQSIHGQAAEWFVRMNESAPSEEERLAFDRWLNADPLNRKEYQAVKGIWRELDGLKDSVITAETNRAYIPGRRTWSTLALAVSMVIVLITGLYFINYNPGSYETAIGIQRMIHLADDTEVRLNSDSLLQVTLTEELRTMHLIRGEAYFDVAHDPARPFVVNAAGGVIRAVGTRFNVYRQTESVRVSVEEGRVEITAASGDKLLLNADQAVEYETDGRIISSVENLGRHDLDWLEDRIVFDASPLTDVVAQLNRYLETPLRITDPGLNELKLSGTFRISNLEALPELLPRLLPLSLDNTGDSLLLGPSD